MQEIDLDKRYLIIGRQGTFGELTPGKTTNFFNEETDFPFASADELKEAFECLLEAKLKDLEFEMVVLDKETGLITRPLKLILTNGEMSKVLSNGPVGKETGLMLRIKGTKREQ